MPTQEDVVLAIQEERHGALIAPQHAYSGGLFGKECKLMLMETLVLDCDDNFPECWFSFEDAEQLGSRMELALTIIAKRWRMKK